MAFKGETDLHPDPEHVYEHGAKGLLQRRTAIGLVVCALVPFSSHARPHPPTHTDTHINTIFVNEIDIVEVGKLGIIETLLIIAGHTQRFTENEVKYKKYIQF